MVISARGRGNEDFVRRGGCARFGLRKADLKVGQYIRVADLKFGHYIFGGGADLKVGPYISLRARWECP